MEECWLAATHGLASCPFINYLLINQFLHQHAYDSARHIHSSGEISAGNWLMLTNEVKRDAPINIARSCAGRYMKIAGVDLAHLQSPPQPICSELGQYTPNHAVVNHFVRKIISCFSGWWW